MEEQRLVAFEVRSVEAAGWSTGWAEVEVGGVKRRDVKTATSLASATGPAGSVKLYGTWTVQNVQNVCTVSQDSGNSSKGTAHKLPYLVP